MVETAPRSRVGMVSDDEAGRSCWGHMPRSSALGAFTTTGTPRFLGTAWEPPPDLQSRWAAGNDFESRVMTRLMKCLGRQAADLRHQGSAGERVQATLAAMTDGTPMILGGRLPDDPAAGRTGLPDLLLRVSAGAERPAYAPGDIKAHKTVQGRRRRGVGLLPPQRPGDASRRSRPHHPRRRPFRRLPSARPLQPHAGCLRIRPGNASRRGFIIGTDALTELDPGRPHP